jgi:predicted SprT family Zn-dependent metalloprotease
MSEKTSTPTTQREWHCDICGITVVRAAQGSLVRRGTTMLCSGCSGEVDWLESERGEDVSLDDVEYLKAMFGMK